MDGRRVSGPMLETGLVRRTCLLARGRRNAEAPAANEAEAPEAGAPEAGAAEVRAAELADTMAWFC